MSFRRGACPALSAPMQTGDGLLVRLATSGASLTPAQLSALCVAAARQGNGLVEITARGNFQIRGLTRESAAKLALDIAAMELGLRDGVPVETNPLAGLDPSETANPAPLAEAIRQAIDATRLASRLGPKVTVIVDGGGAAGLCELSADIRLTAVRDGETVAWIVSIAGDASSARPLGIAGADAAKAATLVILEAIAARGAAARARDLAPATIRKIAGLPACPTLPFGARVNAAPTHLTDGRFALPVALPFGSIDAAGLAAFSHRAKDRGITELRLAPGRSLILLCASEAAASTVREAAHAAGLVVDAGDPRARIFACPGSAGCASGHIPAREIAAAVADRLADEGHGNFELHVSGCAKGCAHPAPAALTLVGTEGGTLLVENGAARENGLSFGNHDVAKRISDDIKHRTGNAGAPDRRALAQSQHAFAGD